MPLYRYVAMNPDGTEVKDEAEAASEEVLRNQLLMQNLEVKTVKPKRGFSQFEITPQRVPRQEIMHFSRQMAAFVRSGIPITDALEVVEDGSSNKRFRAMVSSMRENIEGGLPFADAVAEHAEIFPPYYVGILRSSELTGQLDTALDQLATYIERDLEARSKIKSATIYPAVVMVMSVVTVVILTVFVLPRFTKFFKSLDAELPITTRMLLGVSDVTTKFWFVWVALFLMFVGAVIALQKTDRGRMIRDRWMLRTPLIGQIVLYAVVERFCRIVGAMVEAGVPLPDALNAAIQGTNNRVFEEGLAKSQERMLEGEGMAEPIAALELFPRAAVQMMRVGENTGTLDVQLANAGEYYGRELEYKLKKLTSLFEPAVIIFMGVVVGFVAVALISAMYGVFQGQKTGQ